MKYNDYEKMISGKLYNPIAKDVSTKHIKALWLCERYNKTSIINVFWKNHLLNKLIPSAKNKGVMIISPFFCEYGTNIKLGKDVFLNTDCKLLDVSPIEIGDYSMLGANVTLATPVHPLHQDERRIQNYETGYHDLEYSKPIKIGNNVWIASNVTIIGGVTIGDNVVIGAGSVVTKDIPSNSLAYGVPCKVARQIDEKDKMDVWNTYINEEIPQSIRDKEKHEKS